jgi:hypothetical protein
MPFEPFEELRAGALGLALGFLLLRRVANGGAIGLALLGKPFALGFCSARFSTLIRQGSPPHRCILA